MTRATAPDRRHAFLVRTRPLPTFRVRSASNEPSHLVVVQHDLGLSCNCTAARFGSRTCAHREIARRSITRRTGFALSGDPHGAVAAYPVLAVLQGGRDDVVDRAWKASR